MNEYDVVIVGGGPAGLAGALALGRGCKRVLLCDAGPPRNAAAVHVHNFLTRDGTPPAELRGIGREQLRPYAVDVREARVERIEPTERAVRVHVAELGVVEARRVLLATGMIDVLPDVPGYRALWGASIFQCPYCHGWEVRERAFGYWAPSLERLDWARLLLAWTSDVVAFTGGAFDVPDELRASLSRAGVRLEERAITALREREGRLTAIELEGGESVEREVLFAHPPQRQVPLVEALGLTLDAHGFVQVDAMRETSVPRVHAAGDLTTGMQGAILAAAAGTAAGAMINHLLTMDAE